MEAKVEQNAIGNACCTCGGSVEVRARNIFENFARFKGSLVPFAEIARGTLEFDVSREFSNYPSDVEEIESSFVLAVT